MKGISMVNSGTEFVIVSFFLFFYFFCGDCTTWKSHYWQSYKLENRYCIINSMHDNVSTVKLHQTGIINIMHNENHERQ